MKDKIIFWLDATFLHFCISYYLKKQHECDLYAIVDITNKPKQFFQKQQLVNFKKTWYFFDNIKSDEQANMEYLSEFEKRFPNIHLWKLAINERIFYKFNAFHKFSDNEILSILEHECRLFESILDEVKPDFFITQEPNLHHHQLFYEMCKARRVKVLMATHPISVQKFTITDDWQKPDSFKSISEIKSKNRSFSELQNYIKPIKKSSELQGFKSGFASSTSELLKAGLDFLLVSENSNVKTHYTYYGRNKLRVLIHQLKFLLKKKYREHFINDQLLTNIQNNDSFIYFPLHMDVEKYPLIAAPFYTNQIEVVRHIVKSLPSNYKLYVKEHPFQYSRGWRSIADYKELKSIPNVRLVHPSVESEKLYSKCSLVISISGTSGLEAALYQKPSIILTTLRYRELPSVTQLEKLEDLPYVIRNSLQKKVHASDIDKYLIFLEENSFDFDWMKYVIKESNYFYHNGFFVDVEIPEPKMKTLLEENKEDLEKLALQHVKKIKQYKE